MVYKDLRTKKLNCNPEKNGPEVIQLSTEHETSTTHKKTKLPTNKEVSSLSLLYVIFYHAN